MLSKILSEKYCQNLLSKKTVIDSVFRQILTKNLKNFVECRSILAKNIVEKNCCRKKMLSNYNATTFLCNIFRQRICRRMRSKKIVEPGRKILSKNLAEQCQKILSKKAVA